MNITTTRVRAGEDVAGFCVRLPRFTGQASSNSRMWGKLVDIHYQSVRARDIRSVMTVGISYRHNFYPFGIRTGPAANNAIEAVAINLDRHFGDMARLYPLLQDVPRITLNTVDRNDVHFEVELPARTQLYTTSPVFFAMLRMPAGEVKLERRDVVTGRAPASMIVLGFFNAEYHSVKFRGEELEPGVTLNELLPRGQRMPGNIKLQAEFVDSRRLEIDTPPNEDDVQPATKGNAVRLLRLQFERIRRLLNLRENTIEVVPGPGPTVFVGNRGFPGAGMTMTVEFNPEMTAAYSWEEGQQLVLALDSPRPYEIQVASKRHDPFRDSYPLTIKLSGFGSSNSFIDNHGYTAVLAYLRELKKGEIDITTATGIIFDTDCTYMTLEFLDKRRNRVTFKEEHEITLVLSFKPL
jgi:hypothetical protein